MKLEITGGKSRGGYAGHGEWEDGDPPMVDCPFCGSDDLTCQNTRSPYYQVECNNCGADGPRYQDAGDMWTRRTTKKSTEALHRRAFAEAIRLWNLSQN